MTSTTAGVLSEQRTTRPGKRRRRLVGYLIVTLIALIMIYPLLWMMGSSLKPESDIFTQTSIWPRTFNWHNYVEGWKGFGVSFDIFFENSLFLAVANVIGNVISCSLAAYAFAKLDFPLKRLWFSLMLATLMLPAHVTLIPQYTMFNWLGWVNTFYPLFVPHFFATDAFFVFLMVQFIRGLPTELDEAARIDGCGPVRTFRHIIVPLLIPAMVTTAIFSFIWSYNDFFGQLIYLNDPELFTVPLGLRMFLSSSGESQWGPMFAMSVLALIPVFVIFLAFQRYLVQGIATTGMKA